MDDPPKLYPPTETAKKFPWGKVGRYAGVAVIILAIAAFFLWIIHRSMTGETRVGRAERACREACPTYNAEFVRITDIPKSMDWECWCRRGIEPLRIW